MEARLNITSLLQQIQLGNDAASESLYAQAAERLKRISRSLMTKEGITAGFQASDLVQEAYLQKGAQVRRIGVTGREHFFALMRLGMKQILVDRARRKSAMKRTQPDGAYRCEAAPDARIEDLGRSLEKLKEMDVKVYLVLRLRNDYGLQWSEIAERVGRQQWEVRRDFAFAVHWLREQMQGN